MYVVKGHAYEGQVRYTGLYKLVNLTAKHDGRHRHIDCVGRHQKIERMTTLYAPVLLRLRVSWTGAMSRFERCEISSFSSILRQATYVVSVKPDVYSPPCPSRVSILFVKNMHVWSAKSLRITTSNDWRRMAVALTDTPPLGAVCKL